MSFSVRRVAGVQRDAAQAAELAVAVLESLGYGIDRVEADAGVITTLPAAARADRGWAGGPSLFGRSARVRRLIELRTRETEAGTNVYCRARVQRSATVTQRLFLEDRGTVDTGRTPIDREAGTLPRQNVAWQTVARDRRLEAAILAAIGRRAEPTAPTAPSPPSAPTAADTPRP